MINSADHIAGEKVLVRLSTAGSVDDGKSTLIGRLLLDTSSIYDDTLRSLEKTSAKIGAKEKLALALVTDGLKAEQEQGITIDVAYRYFSTAKRHFILADTPGHEHYTRNMATGASTADITIVLVDATKGILPQTKRHSFIAALMGVPRLLFAVNKMDLVNYSEAVFEKIKSDFSEFAPKLGIHELRFIPISALTGINVVSRGEQLEWYHGESVLEYLQNVYIEGDRNSIDFRFPVQTIVRGKDSFRGYAGQIVSGRIHRGDEIVVLPSMQKSTVKRIDTFEAGEHGLSEASAPQSVVLSFSDEIDVGRGNMIARRQNLPQLQTEFEAMVLWMSDQPMELSKQYIIQHTTAEARLVIRSVQYRIDVNSLSRTESTPLILNEIGRVSFTASKPLALDSYTRNRATGNFIIVDVDTLNTVAAGMVVKRRPRERVPTAENIRNLHAEVSLVSVNEREEKSAFRACTVWLFGYSGSGKSTITKRLERILFDEGVAVVRLDGDSLRGGLNKNLGFSPTDRSENLRRAAEVAKLFNQAGTTVLCSFITTFEADREKIKHIIGSDRIITVHLSTPLSVCEERDKYGLYKKARSGEIAEFTGISSPFEEPKDKDLTIDSSKTNLDDSVSRIFLLIKQRGKI